MGVGVGVSAFAVSFGHMIATRAGARAFVDHNNLLLAGGCGSLCGHRISWVSTQHPSDVLLQEVIIRLCLLSLLVVRHGCNVQTDW